MPRHPDGPDSRSQATPIPSPRNDPWNAPRGSVEEVPKSRGKTGISLPGDRPEEPRYVRGDRGHLPIPDLRAPLEKFLHGGPALQILEQGACRHPGSLEGPVATNLAEIAFHGRAIRPVSQGIASFSDLSLAGRGLNSATTGARPSSTEHCLGSPDAGPCKSSTLLTTPAVRLPFRETKRSGPFTFDRPAPAPLPATCPASLDRDIRRHHLPGTIHRLRAPCPRQTRRLPEA